MLWGMSRLLWREKGNTKGKLESVVRHTEWEIRNNIDTDTGEKNKMPVRKDDLWCKW